MNQDELLNEIEDSRENFLEAIDGLTDEDFETPDVVGTWSIKDLMSHLIAWETELVKLLWELKQGDRPTTVHFGKKSVDALNAEWYALTHERELESVLDDYAAVRKQTIRRILAFTSKELEDPKRFPMLKGKALMEWIAADTYEHENEHAQHILAWRERMGKSAKS